jgi:hypothetical protein
MSESDKINHIRNCYGYGDPMPNINLQQPDTSQVIVNPNEITPLNTSPTATACIDNTGSVQDEGYGFGYNDAQNGRSIASAKDHGNHTDEWRTGYRVGWMAGANDLTAGIHKDPC